MNPRIKKGSWKTYKHSPRINPAKESTIIVMMSGIDFADNSVMTIAFAYIVNRPPITVHTASPRMKRGGWYIPLHSLPATVSGPSTIMDRIAKTAKRIIASCDASVEYAQNSKVIK